MGKLHDRYVRYKKGIYTEVDGAVKHVPFGSLIKVTKHVAASKAKLLMTVAEHLAEKAAKKASIDASNEAKEMRDGSEEEVKDKPEVKEVKEVKKVEPPKAAAAPKTVTGSTKKD